jgi:hypothetical protein
VVPSCGANAIWVAGHSYLNAKPVNFCRTK